MADSVSAKELVLNLQQAFRSPSEDSQLKWDLLKQASTQILNSENNSGDDITIEYRALLNLLLDSLTPVLFKEKWQEQLFDKFFLCGVHQHPFHILVYSLTKSSPSYQQLKILDLLEKFLQNGLLCEMLYSQCIITDSLKLKVMATSKFWEELLTFLVSIPERVANKVNQKPRKIFTIACYVPLVTSSVWKVLHLVYNSLKAEQDCSVEFLSRLVCRLCSSGHANTVVKTLCHRFVEVCEKDFIWRRISHSFIQKMPYSSIETFMGNLLQVIPWYGCMDWLLGDLVLTNPKIELLLTVKFYLVCQFKDDIVLQNAIGYLASSDSRRPTFFKVTQNLLHTWADESVLRHQSFAQQYYLASSLMICASHLKTMNLNSSYRDLRDNALHGVQIRIGSPESLVRNVGMLVGESLVSVFDPDAPKLEFDYETGRHELTHLKELLEIPPKPENFALEENETYNMDFLSEENPVNGSNQECNGISIVKTPSNTPSNLDSDDDEEEEDLKPYNMSNDVSEETVKQPLYIRDCLLGLIEAEKPEWTEQCLRSAYRLIRSNPDDLPDIAAEMSKVLLHLDNSFGMDDFGLHRHRALISLAALCPLQVAPYLTSQFYERDYNIRQRLDILEVVAAASQELSQPTYEIAKSADTVSPTSSVKETESGWRSIIERRLEAKTRRFSTGPRRPVPKPEANLIGSVVGHFFFPLLEKFDRGSKMLNLLGDDSYVLGRLLYTLGIVMYSASNTVQARRMGSCLLKFVAAIRNHTETYVRRAAVFATSTVFTAVPSFHLISDLQDDVLDSQMWLNGVVERDIDVECQIGAAKTVQLLVKTVQEELPSLCNAIHNS